MREASSGKEAELEEMVLPQGLGSDVDTEVSLTNLEDEVGGVSRYGEGCGSSSAAKLGR